MISALTLNAVTSVVIPDTHHLNSDAMIPAKINSEMPLPTPFLVIRSPIHIDSAVPAAIEIPMTQDVMKGEPKVSDFIAPMPTTRPTAWMKPSTTVA